MQKTYRIAALLACHNRREKTHACLRALRAQILPGWNPPLITEEERRLPFEDASPSPISDLTAPICFAIDVFLLDDGSTDGTSEAVHQIWPEATVLRGDGSRFWCGGMRIAWKKAAETNPDYYLLLNDDTIMLPHALAELLRIVPQPDLPAIAVGAIADLVTGAKNYGGTYPQPAPYPPADGRPRSCVLFNGNCVLIPRCVHLKAGMFHAAYTHSMGDMDYSHEARRLGIPILETPVAVGSCDRNAVRGTWLDSTLPRAERIRLLNSPKGLPYREWWVFCRRNCGARWLRYFLSPTLRILLQK